MMSLTFGLFTQVSDPGPHGPLVFMSQPLNGVMAYRCPCVCVFQNHVWDITEPYLMGFENNLAQMIIMTR